MRSKRLKIPFITLSIVGMLLLNISMTYAEDTHEVPVTLDYGDQLFIIEVDVNEGGYVKDGSQKIENSIVQFEQKIGDEKNFEVIANQGYQLKSVIYELEERGYQEDITAQLVNGKLKIQTMPEKSIITVTFEKEEEIPTKTVPITPSQKGDVNHNGLSTGDSTNIVMLINVSLFAIFIIYRKRKERYEQD